MTKITHKERKNEEVFKSEERHEKLPLNEGTTHLEKEKTFWSFDFFYRTQVVKYLENFTINLKIQETKRKSQSLRQDIGFIIYRN